MKFNIEERKRKVNALNGFNLIFLSSIFIFLFFISSASAQPPFLATTTGTTGYILVSIEPPSSIVSNNNFYLHFHILNNSNGKLVNSSITCFYHLTNPSGLEIFEGKLTQDVLSLYNSSYESTISGANFSITGQYNILTQCLDGSGISGITNNIVDVSTTGFTNTLGFYFILILIIICIFILGYSMENNYIMTLGSITILFLGFFVISYGIDVIKSYNTTRAIGIIIWAVGIIAIFKSMEEQLKVYG